MITTTTFEEDMSPSRIFHRITSHPIGNAKDYTYIILGDGPCTGKSWLCNALRQNGFNAIEISEDIIGLVTYRDRKNHVKPAGLYKQIVIILNRPLRDQN